MNESIPTPDPALTPLQVAELLHYATTAAYNSYSPYSHFRVGAAVLLESPTETIVTGCNVENASYRLTTCAEQTAIATAVNLYGPGLRIRAIAIANLNNAACQPCGACRQTIAEFSAPTTPVFYPAADGTPIETTVANLLPSAFVLTSKEQK